MNLNLRTDTWEIGKSLPVSANDFPELIVSNGKNGHAAPHVSHSKGETAEKENPI